MTEPAAGAAGPPALPEQAPVLLQVCANDAPPFADICHYHAACAALLGWRPVTVMLAARSGQENEAFHYLDAAHRGRGPAASAATAFDAALTELLDGAPVVLTLCHRYRAYRAAVGSAHGIEPLVAVAHEFGLLRRRQRRLQRHWDRLLGRPRVTFAGVSEPVRRELMAVTGRAALLPNGIDLARCDGRRLARPDARAALGLASSDQAFVIGVVGRLHPKKCPELALDGFRRAQPDLPGARLVFVGDGELRPALEGAAGDAPVSLTGFLADAARYMAAFDLLLLPSGDREAFGMVAIEAMAAAVPVLCGPAPGPRYVVGNAGRMIERQDPGALADALRALYAEHRSGELAELGVRGRERVAAEFSVQAGARRLAGLAGFSGTDSAVPAGAS